MIAWLLTAGLRRWRQGTLRQLPRAQALGPLGEDLAADYLERAGFRIHERNWRPKTGRGELDIIASEGGVLVFVEVKTRSSEEWARPAAAVDAAKRRRLSLTAEDYLRQLEDRRVASRFDVVEVLLAGGEVRDVRHVINAFPYDPRPVRRFR